MVLVKFKENAQLKTAAKLTIGDPSILITPAVLQIVLRKTTGDTPPFAAKEK